MLVKASPEPSRQPRPFQKGVARQQQLTKCRLRFVNVYKCGSSALQCYPQRRERSLYSNDGSFATPHGNQVKQVIVSTYRAQMQLITRNLPGLNGAILIGVLLVILCQILRTRKLKDKLQSATVSRVVSIQSVEQTFFLRCPVQVNPSDSRYVTRHLYTRVVPTCISSKIRRPSLSFHCYLSFFSVSCNGQSLDKGPRGNFAASRCRSPTWAHL